MITEKHNQVVVGAIYEHYKGKRYKVLGVSCSSEDLSWYVVYETLYNNEVSNVWHRPLDMFVEAIEIDGAMVERFKRVEE